MYFGHYALAAAIRARKPSLPLVPVVVGVGVLDVLDGIFVLAGLGKVTPNLAALPYLYFDLTQVDWDHSLLMAALWSLGWGALFLPRREVAFFAALAAFSHFVLDWPMHDADLALFPHSSLHLGLGLWRRLGAWSWGLELALSAVLLAYAWVKDARRGSRPVWPTVLIALLAVPLSPWLSPMQWAARLPEPTAHLAYGALLCAGYVPLGLLVWLYSRGPGRQPPGLLSAPRPESR